MILVDKINRSGDLVNELCRDGNAVNKAYRSGELIYQRCVNEDYVSRDYFSFEIISGGSICWKNIYYEQLGVYTPQSIYYKINDGWWNLLVSNPSGATFNVNAGDYVSFKGNYDINTTSDIPSFCGTTATFNACGNIMSLIYGDNFEGVLTMGQGKQFDDLFFRCNTLINAKDLLMPATTLSYSCYQGTFRYCSSLITAPELPATNLTELCYNGMFIGCTSLASAPELPATTLASDCYLHMFGDCSSLNYVKCLATDISASGCVSDWLKNVSSSGTFVKAASMSSWTTGNSGIPSGWTVVNA